MEKVFNVTGMHCSHCIDKIEKFVGEIDGVEFVEVNLEQQQVRVIFNPKNLEFAIKDAILDSGFEIQE